LEAWFHHRYRIHPVSDAPDCLLAYNRERYGGPEVALRCGGVVRPGDLILELHFRREALLPLFADPDPRRLGLELLRLADRDVPLLARVLQEREDLRDVRALHALTLFHRGIRRYGFEVLPVAAPLTQRWFTFWHRLLMARDHPAGRARVREHAAQLVTRHVWISREALSRRCAAPASIDSALPPSPP
jgi:hypothetical protein